MDFDCKKGGLFKKRNDSVSRLYQPNPFFVNKAAVGAAEDVILAGRRLELSTVHLAGDSRNGDESDWNQEE